LKDLIEWEKKREFKKSKYKKKNGWGEVKNNRVQFDEIKKVKKKLGRGFEN